jgi:Xaa-Pro aminopeptidase
VVRESLEKRKLDGFLVTNMTNVRYLSGFTGSSGCVLISMKKNIFITDFRYKEQAHKEIGGRGDRWDISIEKSDRLGIIKGLIKRLGIRTLGFEASVSYEFFEGLSRCGPLLTPLRETVERQRMIKDSEEVGLIREAVRRAEDAFLEVKPYIRQGRKERNIAFMLEERLREKGCNRIPFDIIVASGPNSAMPHARATERKLSPGDFVVIDWGGEAEGYCSDMTRTFLVKGAASAGNGDIARKKEIYRQVFRANRKAISIIAPGIGSREVDRAARDLIREAGYAAFFGHGTGHGVGLEVHELPRVTRRKGEKVREGMVFTVEPGIYIEGVGGVRIEDMVLVRPEGPEVLTKLSRSLEVI